MYLLGSVFLILGCILFSPLSLHMDVYVLLYFLDYQTIFFMVLVCVLALLCTKSWKHFYQGFFSVLGKKELATAQCKQSLLAMQLVTHTALLFALMQGVILWIDFWAQPERTESLEMVIGLSVLPLFYALFVVLLLLPVQFILKRKISSAEH